MRKKGISLIVLLITILVILIIATAILLGMVKNNPINQANKAVNENDFKVAQEAVAVWVGNRMLSEEGKVNENEIGALYSGTVTKAPSDVEANLEGNISLIQVTLEDFGLSELEELVIEGNKVVSITKNGITYDGEHAEVVSKNAFLSFDANGGEGSMERIEVEKGQQVTISSNVFKKSDYLFVNWNTKRDGTGKSYLNGEKITLDKNITLYAQWKIKYATLYIGTTTGKPVVRNANVQDDYYSGNYDLPRSLYALMEAETGAKNLAYSSNNSYLSIGSGSYTLTESSDTDVWLGLWFSRDGDINMNRIDSLKVIFEDEKIMTVSEAINHNYLDPLILCASSSNYGYIYGNILLLLEGGSTTSQRWVSAFLFFKVKSKKITGLQVVTDNTALRVIQMPSDWKLSKEPW